MPATYDVPDPYHPQPGQTWQPTRFEWANPARHITAVVPNEAARLRTRTFRVHYRNVLPKRLGGERSCWLGQFEDWVALCKVVAADLPPFPATRPPSRAALGRAVVEAAREWARRVETGRGAEPDGVAANAALLDAVRAYEAAADDAP